VVTLRQQDAQILSQRVLDPSRKGAFRDVQAALALSELSRGRPAGANEWFVDVGDKAAVQVRDEILFLLEQIS
jgi:hypothetical protein